MNEAPVVFLMGPTGAGKTATVFALSTLLPIDVISVDAAQIYRGLNIGTAKPSLAERRLVPHRLIDIRSVAESYSAAAFCHDARLAIAASIRRQRLPVLVGGSSFYFRALEQGLPDSPAADPVLRAELLARAQREGLPTLYRELVRRDPERAVHIAPTDPQRIVRALEIVMVLGKVPPVSAPGTSFPYTVIKFAVSPRDRSELHERIARRFKTMLARGLIDEGIWLYGQSLAPTAPALRLVGYRQVGEYLRDKIQYTDLVLQGTAATRQLAKRQLTWLRNDPAVEWLDSSGIGSAEACATAIQESVKRKRDHPSAGDRVPQ
ncbi:MAG TPA: tRNA (adenosine(37)-N6)-dimethylallyltransferase MiaA [Acidiferrobacter sp.]|nr:tRNA (adenosine(37)-N6)-dimethylallyltransferase MiaA [Acidiferrobacter sp.]